MVKVWRDIAGKRIQQEIPKKQLSKRSLGQLNRWKKAKKLAKIHTKLSKQKVSSQQTFRQLRKLSSDKAIATAKRRGKEFMQRKASKDSYDPERPYYRHFWEKDKQVHEHTDKYGFKFRYIDYPTRWNKIRKHLKQKGDLRVWAVMVVTVIDEAIDVYGDGLTEGGNPIHFAFAGELDSKNPLTYKLLRKAKEGSQLSDDIIEYLEAFKEVAEYNVIESFENRAASSTFEGFVVSMKDIGKTRAKY